MSPPDEQQPSLEDKIAALSRAMLALDTGPLAALRRMTPGPEEIGPAAWWRLAAQCGFLGQSAQTERWQHVVKIMALLVPKGTLDSGVRLHDGGRPLGAVFCDGGSMEWGKGEKGPPPVLSETRLARFLALPPGQHAMALERIIRSLSRTRDPKSGVNCVELASLLLAQNPTRALQNIARAYYQRLDSAHFSAKKKDAAA